jgi:hypothetical protein
LAKGTAASAARLIDTTKSSRCCPLPVIFSTGAFLLFPAGGCATLP